MEIISIAVLALGLLLGGVIAWLYAKSQSKPSGISVEEYENLKASNVRFQMDSAVLNERASSVENDLKDVKDNLNRTASDLQKALQDLEALRVIRDNSNARYQELIVANTALTEVVNRKTEELVAAEKTIVRLEQEVKSVEGRLKTQKADFDEIKANLEKEFKLIAGTILDNSAQKLHDQQNSQLKIILDPLRENINTFKQEITTRYNEENKERASLRTEIKQVIELNSRLSEEANNLTNALKGNTKQQGDWGEIILESILEYVGLQKNIHYAVQETATNAEGARLRPDVLVKYPDNRVVVIDSKVTLVSYEQFTTSTNVAEQEQYRAALVRSMKTHIDGLSGKKYTDLPGSLDTVMMFVPIEAAFITAQQGDPKLWQYAYDKGIILLSPTILLGAMKLIYDYWKRDEINKNAQEIAKRAGALYDKLVGFVDNMEDVGKHLDKAKGSYTDAFNQLKTGRGNLINQATELRRLGIEAKKVLPQNLVTDAELGGTASVPGTDEISIAQNIMQTSEEDKIRD